MNTIDLTDYEAYQLNIAIRDRIRDLLSIETKMPPHAISRWYEEELEALNNIMEKLANE